MKRALFSLYDTSRVKEFAEALVKGGWEIIASRETVDILSKAGVPVIDIADFVNMKIDYGFPPTLHSKVEAALTDNKSPDRIDLVYVINYPISVGNDIGGRTLLALAAKGKRIPVTSVEDMASLVSQIEKNGGISESYHAELLDKTNAKIGKHFLGLIRNKEKYDEVLGEFNKSLANGENPYQVPSALFVSDSNDELALGKFKQLSGEAPCFTNLADCDCLIQTISLCAQASKLRYGKIPYICAAAKHGNVCGLSIDWKSPAQVINSSLFANPQAIWGGEVVTNFKIDGDLSQFLLKSQKRQEIIGDSSWMLDVVMAPEFTKEAEETLGKRKQRKLLQSTSLYEPFLPADKYTYRFVRGGFLRQPPANYVLNLEEAEFIGGKLADNAVDSLIIAWTAAFSSNHGGNEIALAKSRSLIACAGGPSTVEAAKLAVFKAGYLKEDLKNAVFAADAFFPFTDAPQILTEAGVSAGLVPSGGKAFLKVKEYFQKYGINIFYIPEQYRGFCRH